jgi:tetratricopeptide (TPR) repeat protein/predicted Ser/Thr protein kinase
MPVPSAFGRFVSLRALGSGAMGEVFLGADPNEAKPKPVAIKLLKNRLPALEARFRREFRVLQKLEHPYVVRVLEFGEGSKGSYLVMEYIDGDDLSRWQGEPPATPEAVRRVVKIAAKIAQGLEHVHRAGVIHRDLKPENILVAADDIPKLTDFGLARDTNASAMTHAGRGGFLGTLLYAAPEQIQGRSLDHRADLYAFGMLLYRLLTGETAFGDRDVGQIVLAQLRERPRAPSTLNPMIPANLEQVIMQLLEKNPADRPDSAAHVQGLLEVLSGELKVATGTSSMTLTGVEGLTLADVSLELQGLLEAPFLGREPLLAETLKATSAAVLFEGETGIGKTRLLREYLRERTFEGCRSYEATPSPGLRLPLEALAQWLRAALARARAQAIPMLEFLLDMEGPTLANLVPEFERKPLTLRGGQVQFTLFSSALRFLLQISDRPVVLALEHAERADEATLAFIAFALRNLSGLMAGEQSLRFVITRRSEGVSDSVRNGVKALVLEGLLTRFLLPPLALADAEQMVRAMLGGPTDRALIEHVLDRSRGNPWMASEVLRELLETGQVFKRRRYWEWSRIEAGLSPGLREAFEARFLKLTSSAQELAAFAAVIGEVLDFDSLLELSGLEENPLLDDLERLIRAKVLIEERQGRSELYRFAHPLMREAALEGLSARRRRRLHARYAESLAAKGAEPAMLAVHLALAGLGERAAAQALEAAKRAEAVFALSDSEAVVRQALAALEPASLESASDSFQAVLSPEALTLKSGLELMLGKIATLTGRSDEAERLLKNLLERYAESHVETQAGIQAETQAETKLALAKLYQRQSRWPEAIELLEPDLGPNTSADSWCALVSSLRLSGRIEQALERAIDAETHLNPEPGWQSFLEQQRASAYLSLGQTQRAQDHAVRAVALAESLKDPEALSRALITLGRIERKLVRYGSALEHYEQAQVTLTKLGDLRGIAAVEINIAAVLLDSRDFSTVIQRLENALEIAERGGYQDLIASVYYNLGEAHAFLAAFDRVAYFANLAVEQFSQLSGTKMLVNSLLMLVQVQVVQGLDPTTTLQTAAAFVRKIDEWQEFTLVEARWKLKQEPEQAIAMLKSLHQGNPASDEIRLLLAEALRSTGKTKEARLLLKDPSAESFAGVQAGLEMALELQSPDWFAVREQLEQHGQWVWMTNVNAWREQVGAS